MTDPPTNLTLESGPRDDDERMVRYIVGECSPMESARTQEWIAADSARWERFRELERVWRACGREASRRWNAESALVELRTALGSRAMGEPVREGERDAEQRFESRAEDREGRRTPVAPLTLGGLRDSGSPGRRSWSGRLGKLAATFALLVVGTVGWRAIAGRWPGSSGHHTEVPVPLQTVSTARGQRATITLSDGSRIVLGAGSSVRYARDFGARARRDVYLEGQAFFEVAHDTLRPFVVHTSRGAAEDLGTQFVVTAYPDAFDMQVVVATGKVLLRGAAPSSSTSSPDRARGASPLTLEPGELGKIDSSGALSRSRVVDTSQYFDWTKGELTFRGVPLREALPAIGRWYDVEIVLGDTSLASRRLVASFGPHSASEVVRLVALAVDARYVQRGDTVVLLARRAGRR
ncbi:MAG TPA: FecR domain-containing protein [Gemmatimonadaceae bacterium]|nr:FecR domain-containing protein [Gemmatimonadaceae bacterium]